GSPLDDAQALFSTVGAHVGDNTSPARLRWVDGSQTGFELELLTGPGPEVRVRVCKSASPTPPVLQVNGTAGGDFITIDQVGPYVRVTFNGVVAQYCASSLTAIVVTAGDGNDAIDVHSTPAVLPVTIDAGGGDDWITVGANDRLDQIRGPVFVDGGGGV